MTTIGPLWEWSALSAGLADVECEGTPAQPIQRVVIDSRVVEPGDLFVALPGDPGPRFNPSYRSSVDGHDFVVSAYRAGAAAAMVHRVSASMREAQVPLLKVRDTYDGLWALGALARHRFDGTVVAVTGSSGKTTAKQFLAFALEAYAPPGSLNNHIGVPLTLANVPAPTRAGGTWAAILELGTNHPGEIEPLARLAAPDYAVLLNVQDAHIENFANRAALVDEKVSIFKGLKDTAHAISLDTLELDFGYTFGTTRRAHARITNLEGDRVKLQVLGKTFTARVPGGGEHRALTVAMTVLCAELTGHDPGLACALPHELVPKGRGDERTFGGVTVIDESYNANPASMKATLTAYAKSDRGGRKWAVIGEMLELGDTTAAAHAALRDHLAPFDGVLCVGEGTRALAVSAGWPHYDEADETLCAHLVEVLQPGDSVLFKGSNRVFWQAGFVTQVQAALTARY